MKKQIITNFRFFISLFDYVLPKDEKKVAFLMFPKQENKTDALYDWIKKNTDYKCVRISDQPKTIKNKTDLVSFYSFKGLFELFTSKYIVISVPRFMLDYIKSKRHYGVNLWHGMPIKKIGINADIKPASVRRFKYVGKYFKTFVTSDIFRLIMATSFMAECKNVHVTGLPITDTIFSNKNNEKVEKLFDIKKYDKVIAYLPTFKSQALSHSKQIEHEFNNIFYFDDYNEKQFFDFLEKNNILFVVKPHPLDEKLYKNNADKISKNPRIRVLYDADFVNNDIDLYDMYKYFDLMISDFSSTALDFLILNKPVLYLDNLSKEYSEHRGMSLPDNYDIFLPGHKVKTFKELDERLNSFLKKDDTKELRDRAMPFIHKYCDDKACSRIFRIMQGEEDA